MLEQCNFSNNFAAPLYREGAYNAFTSGIWDEFVYGTSLLSIFSRLPSVTYEVCYMSLMHMHAVGLESFRPKEGTKIFFI